MKVIGFTDNCSTCGSCGKSNLKGTFIVFDEGNNDFYYGSECVKKITGISAPNKSKAKNDLLQLINVTAHSLALDSNLLNPGSYDDVFVKNLSSLKLKYKINK